MSYSAQGYVASSLNIMMIDVAKNADEAKSFVAGGEVR